MAGVTLRAASKHFGDVAVLRGIDLDIADGEFMVFVGPSGCGKSTLLRLIAGLEEASSGEIRIGDRIVNDVAPADRGIAMVFQSYALYPHMTLYDNLAFALKLAKTPKAEIDVAVTAAARMLGIEDLLTRKPKTLSGGQRQRVAIGRAIVRKPQVFLFDEPLSNLDAALRVRMRYEFASLHRQLKTTMIYVTHDQVEAMTLADRIAVLSNGVIAQVGTPMGLYEHPDNLFVAGFIGSPRMNFLAGTIEATSAAMAQVRIDPATLLDVAVDARRATVGDAVTIGVRPEDVAADGTANPIAAAVRFVESLGSVTYAYLDHPAATETLTAQIAGPAARVGEVVTLSLPPGKLHLFDSDGVAFARLGSVASQPTDRASSATRN